MKKTVLIFGISSFVGSNLATLLKDEYRIIGTYHKTPVEIPGITCLPCDVLKKDYVMNLTGLFKPDFTIYAVGLSSLTDCKINPKLADALNMAGAVNVCVGAERYGSKFIFISSSFVLGGEDQLYKEGDTPFPITAYGTSLSSTEFYVQRSCLNYIILRTAPLYGRSYSSKHPTWFETVQASFVKNEAVMADDTVTSGFLDIAILSKILKSILSSGVTNRLFQVSSRDYMTRFEFAKKMAKVFKKDENLIQRSSSVFPIEQSNSKIGKAPSSHYYFKMDIQNIETFMGLKLPSVEESLMLTQKRLS